MKLMKNTLCLVCLLGLSVTTIADLVVKEGYVRKPIPGRTMTAAFMDIHNTATTEVVLTRAKLEGAKRVEIHTHTHEDGMMKMREIFELPIKAGQTVTLKPGGLHLMIFGITHLPENPKLELCSADKICYSTTIESRSLVKKH